MTNRGRGLMWQIEDMKKPLSESIEEACRRFRKKYGSWPTLVTVNEVALAESGIESNDHVRGERMTPKSHIHLWGIPKDGRLV